MTMKFKVQPAKCLRAIGSLARLSAAIAVAVALLAALAETKAQTPSTPIAGVDAALLEDVVIGSRILADSARAIRPTPTTS
jgi:hypothetical protein